MNYEEEDSRNYEVVAADAPSPLENHQARHIEVLEAPLAHQGSSESFSKGVKKGFYPRQTPIKGTTSPLSDSPPPTTPWASPRSLHAFDKRLDL
jgi:hypothetical protein